MLHLVLCVFVTYTAIWSVDGSSYEFPYVPHTVFTKINYQAHQPRGVKPSLDRLLKGQTVDTFEEVMFQNLLNISAVCDVSRYGSEEKEVLFTPSVCSENCDKPGVLDKYTNASCINRRFSQIKNGICCPANEVPWYKDHFPEKKYYEWREFPNARFFKDIVLTAHTRNRTYGNDYKLLTNQKFMKRFSRELVCGLRAEKVEHHEFIDPLSYDVDYHIFICTNKSNCPQDQRLNENSELRAHPQWHELCRRFYEGYAEPRDYCCNLQLLPNDYFEHDVYNVSTFVLPGVPFYTNFMPGLRSTYACESYSKEICRGNENWCIVNNHVKNFPFMVRLGVVAPNVMLFHCLGSIISRRYIMSSWGCRSLHGIDTNVALVGDDEEPENLLRNRTTEDIYIIVKVLNAYQDWNSVEPEVFPKEIDIALFQTSEDIKFTPFVRPACIYHQFYDYKREGYLIGRRTHSAVKSMYEQKYQLIVGSDTGKGYSCDTHRPYNDETNPEYARAHDPSGPDWGGQQHDFEFCTGNLTSGNAPCEDVGAPLVSMLDNPLCQWIIKGILVSERKYYCERFQYGIFHNVTKILEAIEDHVWPLPFLDYNFNQKSCEN